TVTSPAVSRRSACTASETSCSVSTRGPDAMAGRLTHPVRARPAAARAAAASPRRRADAGWPDALLPDAGLPDAGCAARGSVEVLVVVVLLVVVVVSMVAFMGDSSRCSSSVVADAAGRHAAGPPRGWG